MRNRAKCRKCKCIIESIDKNDWAYCECSEIGVSGGQDNYKCYASDFANFLRVDDENNEIIVRCEQSPCVNNSVPILNRSDLLNMLDEMIKSIESLPEHAKLTSINHYDYSSLLYLLAAIFRSK